jgi:hypothetical protein
MNTRHVVVLFAALSLGAFAQGCGPEGLGDPGAPVEDFELIGVSETGDEITTRYPAGTTARTTTALNLRTGPSTSNRVLVVMPPGSSVRLVDGVPQAGWYRVAFSGREGFCFGQYLTVTGAPSGGGTMPMTPAPSGSRGFLDPDRDFHNIFGGVEWSVSNQTINLRSGAPTGSTVGIAACMARYGASIRRWADHYNVSRAAVVATAITESNCTNPAGSSDGLSSGPMQVTGSTCAGVTGLSSATCKARMHSDPDFSFEVGVRYIASSYQRNQHGNDGPKLAAAYNAGSLRSTTANRWHMVSTGNHIDRFVEAYNAYRAWERSSGAFTFAPETVTFNGEHVARESDLPSNASEGQTYFVGDWEQRDGHFFMFYGGSWHQQ